MKTSYHRLGPGTNCSAIFGKYGQAGAIKKYRQLGWEISVNWRPEQVLSARFVRRLNAHAYMCSFAARFVVGRAPGSKFNWRAVTETQDNV